MVNKAILLARSFGLTRLGLTVFFVAVGLVFMFIAQQLASNTWGRDLLVNLAPEAIGVVFTIAILDWLNELRQSKAESERIAQVALHQLDHAVWVWQGGSRELDFGELLGLLDEVEDEDPMPSFLTILLLQLGSESADTYRLKKRLCDANPILNGGIQRLRGLAGIHDGELPKPTEVAVILRDAAISFWRVFGREQPRAFLDPKWTKDVAVKSQMRRHYGEQPATTSNPPNA